MNFGITIEARTFNCHQTLKYRTYVENDGTVVLLVNNKNLWLQVLIPEGAIQDIKDDDESSREAHAEDVNETYLRSVYEEEH